MRSTPVTLITRKNLPVWTALVKARRRRGSAAQLARAGGRATIWRSTAPPSSTTSSQGLDLPRTFVEEALGELVAVGLVNSDGFSGLRALLLPSDRRKPLSAADGGGAPRCSASKMPDAGR